MRHILGTSAVLWGILTVPVAAQVTVQQPVVQSFSANTSVSVPDRGWATIGGVSSAAAGRSTSGPVRTGSSVGRQAQASSLSTGVFIHDLRAMDEALLATAPVASSTSAWERKLAERRGESLPSTSAKPPVVVSDAAKFEALALQAEERGKPSLAVLYWRVAAKEGSALARSKLAKAR
jgi:hypothetical protein